MSVEQQEKGQDKGQEKGQSGALTGKTFGGYRIGESLSQSGSSAASTVYVAEPTAGGDKVVLRVFSVDLSKDKNLSARLVADVQKACAVSHPNLVPVREIGTADYKGKRHLYVATERLEGESLKSRLAQKGASPVELSKALHIASQVGAALQAIHRANGTHRQVGLGSVFIGRGGDQEKVYLLDLGSALVPADAGGGDKGGKAGKGGKIQDDIRSLAHLVQELLGGVPSGDGATGAQAVLPLRLRNPKVPARLDAVLRSALGDTLGAADRSSRFDSVAGFVAALFGTGETQPSYLAWSEDGRTAPRPRASVSPNLLWAAGAIAVIIGILVVAWISTQETPPAAAPDLATAVVTPPAPAPNSEPKVAPVPSPTPSAVPDAGVHVGRPGAWPPRTGVIPQLRDADPAPPPPAAAPPAATPAAVRAPAPAPVPASAAGAGASAPPPTGAAPATVRAPAPAPAGGAGAGPQSAPAAPKTPPAAKPPAPSQGPGAPAPAPGSSGQKEVK